VTSKRKGKDANALQWAKTSRDLVELRNETLEKIKAHLLGRDETGAIIEPENYWDHNQQIEFERYFKDFLMCHWTPEDLKLECVDCHVKSEDVSNYELEHPYPQVDEHLDLCEKCYQKRTTESRNESNDTDTDESEDEKDSVPASSSQISAILQSTAMQIKVLDSLPLDQRITKLEELLAYKFNIPPGMEPAYEAYRAVLQKELDKAKST
jgi:hypothetical protein